MRTTNNRLTSSREGGSIIIYVEATPPRPERSAAIFDSLGKQGGRMIADGVFEFDLGRALQVATEVIGAIGMICDQSECLVTVDQDPKGLVLHVLGECPPPMDVPFRVSSKTAENPRRTDA